jgi:hypothetical protein
MEIHLPGNRSVMERVSSAPAGGAFWWVARSLPTLVLLAMAGLLVEAGAAEPKKTTSGKETDNFMPYVQLAPFVVNGKQLAISIHARSEKDRHYAEQFAEEVVKVVYESVTVETGKGLVIIGKKGEPHPIFVFRKFQALAQAGALDPAVAAYAPELDAMLNRWQDTAGEGKASDGEGGEDVDLEFEKIVTALPLPLEGIGAKLYQLAWAEKFNDAKVEARLRALHAGDLEGNLFARFDWVFYLPPRGALEQAIDGIITEALKQEEMGFITRMAVKGALMMVKPMIRKAIEGVRQGMLFMAVTETRSGYTREEVGTLTGAYIDALMPEHKKEPGSEHERAVRAVREQVRLLGERKKEPTAIAGTPASEETAAAESIPAKN